MMPLKKILDSYYGKIFPISGGSGGSKDDPIIITTEDRNDAAITQYEILRFFFEGNGWIWSQNSREFIPYGDSLIEKVSSEVKYIDENSPSLIITEKRNFYFDVTMLSLKNGEKLPPITIKLSEPYGSTIHKQIRWLHFDKIFNNETLIRGAGYTLFYSAPQIKTSLYIYNSQKDEAIISNPDEEASREFKNVCAMTEASLPTFSILSEHKLNNSYWKVYVISDGSTFVILAPYKNYFVKCRTTISTHESFIWDCAVESLKSLFYHL